LGPSCKLNQVGRYVQRLPEKCVYNEERDENEITDILVRRQRVDKESQDHQEKESRAVSDEQFMNIKVELETVITMNCLKDDPYHECCDLDQEYDADERNEPCRVRYPFRRRRCVRDFAYSFVPILPDQSASKVSDDDDKKGIKSSTNQINYPVGDGKRLIRFVALELCAFKSQSQDADHAGNRDNYNKSRGRSHPTKMNFERAPQL